MKWTKRRVLKTLKDLALGSHLTSLSVDSVDGHLLLCELPSSSLPPSTPRVAAAYVTGVRTNLWSASAPCSFRTLFRALCNRHRNRSFAKLNMERYESADNRRARVVLLEHAPCGSSVCLLQERKRSRVPRFASAQAHFWGTDRHFSEYRAGYLYRQSISKTVCGVCLLFCRLLWLLQVQKCYQLPPLRHHVGDMWPPLSRCAQRPCCSWAATIEPGRFYCI